MTTIRNRIEQWFEILGHRIYENKYKTLIVMVFLIAGILSQLPKLTFDMSNEGFLHEDDQSLIDYNAFRDQFGRDELILIAVSTPNVFDRNFLGKLRAFHEDLEEKVPYVDEITSLINARDTHGEGDVLVVEDLLEEWPETDEQLARVKARALANPTYKNILLSEDSTITTIIIKTQTYSSIGNELDLMEGFEEGPEETADQSDPEQRQFLTTQENSKAVHAAYEIADKYDAPDFEVFITGSASISYFQKKSMKHDMQTFVKFALLSIILFLFIMFRKISGVVLPLVIVIISFLSAFSIMAAFGAPIKLPTQILPSLLLAVSVGYSVHLLSMFYQHFRKGDDKAEAIAYSLGHSGLAIVMTAVTTAAGLFSISTSSVAPIADLGIFGGVGVLLSMLYTIIVVPALLAILPVKSSAAKDKEVENTAMDRLLAGVARISTGHPVIILAVSFVLIGVSIFYIPKINFSHDVLRWFQADNPIRIATEKINEEMRGTVNISAIIDTGKVNGLYDPNLLKRIDETCAYLETLEVDAIFVGKAWSITTILKESNRALNENKDAFYRIPEDEDLIAQEFLLFENSGSDDMEDFVDSQFSKANLIMKIPFEDAVAYTRFLEAIREHFDKTYPDVKVTITGMGEIMFRTKVNAANSMVISYIYALVVITFFMVLLIGKLRIGLLSMIPNLAPIVITLGIMGYFQIELNLFTMLVANIAIGLAVDDTIHFMHNFRRYFEQSGDAKLAVQETLHTAGRAMVVTSCVLSIGFFVFMFADMNNVSNFGLLTGTTIVLALLADFFISPALMVVVNRKQGGK
jgi:hydrophobe/amphiphile efflux-3 (HAE3) family protein